MTKRLALSALGSVLFVAPSFAGSNVLEYDVETGSAGGQSDQSVGWQFDVVETITVQALTWADEDLDGLSHSHETGIWAPDGTLLVSVVIPVGTEADLRGIWRSVSVEPVVLTPGTGYIVGGLNASGSTDRLAFDVDLTFVNPAIHFVDATFAPANGNFERPTNFSSAFNGFYGPSFQVGTEVPACFTVTGGEVNCHPDGSTFTWAVEGVNACTGANQMFSFTGSGGAPGEQFCFTVTINDDSGAVCCTTELCTEVPDCLLPAHACDVDGDAVVGTSDLFALLGAWGPCPALPDPGGVCAADLDDDGFVGTSDLLELLSNWGSCP
jgi:hypothetical protein